MIKFFTKQEFNDRAEKFYKNFRDQCVSKNFKNVHITKNINKGTTMIYNNATGKVGFAKCHPLDEFSLVTGIGIAWQKYCGDYFEPVFIKQLNDVRSLSDGDCIICKPSQHNAKTREVYRVIDKVLTKSTITGKEILLLKVKNIRTNEELLIHEFEKIYVLTDEAIEKMKHFWKVE